MFVTRRYIYSTKSPLSLEWRFQYFLECQLFFKSPFEAWIRPVIRTRVKVGPFVTAQVKTVMEEAEGIQFSVKWVCEGWVIAEISPKMSVIIFFGLFSFLIYSFNSSLIWISQFVFTLKLSLSLSYIPDVNKYIIAYNLFLDYSPEESWNTIIYFYTSIKYNNFTIYISKSRGSAVLHN